MGVCEEHGGSMSLRSSSVQVATWTLLVTPSGVAEDSAPLSLEPIVPHGCP